ncbi:glycoside hydrolase family 68 protein [Novosphingobium flavum]|uniref:Glycoside hydrolase family 68 protein n=1 Tax=Novosphingobium flavum TaxID=1778672 RepID=A0A7X1FS39_9SPHN|nr:glycoside hydrolase family 68 protein [Novosphingobium flavum]MBC2665933.1 glycoside hydrolase family 68 protein [Novosphingobium flavum]
MPDDTLSHAHSGNPLQVRPLATGAWRPERFGADGGHIPLIGAEDVRPLVPGLDLWDCWPLTRDDGSTAAIGGRHYWFFLSAPQFPDPVQRHGQARIRLLSHGADGWRDHGNALPDGLNPGSREWAGSAVLHEDGVSLTLYFTAAGRRGEQALTFEQRLFAVDGRLGPGGTGDWGEPAEIVAADGSLYALANDAVERGPGTLKAFRDPFYFRDPATGKAHIVFTASAGWSDDPHNGMIGLATLTKQGWILGDPLVEAIGVNNELERAQAHFRDGRYYLFWSTQSHTFAPGAPKGPNGLYGMVGESLRGPWRPVNGSGLVAANPANEPAQSYSWVVTGEDEVWSFVDYWGLAGRGIADHPELLRSHFGGTAAPVFKLAFAGDRVDVI